MIRTTDAKLLLATIVAFLGFAPLVSPAVGQTAVTPSTGIISWWPGDGNANDIIDGNNGTVNGPVAFAPGLVGQAFLFDGSSTSVNAGNAANLHVSAGDFTIEAWVNFNSAFNPDSFVCTGDGCDMSIVDKMAPAALNPSSDNLDGWRLLKQAHGYFLFCLGGGASNRCGDPNQNISVFSQRGSVTTGVWYHVAVTKTSTTLSLYVNGVLANQNTTLGAFTDTNSTNLLIGANVSEGAHTSGQIDEVTLYNRALSAAEISAIFVAGSSGKYKFTPVTILINGGVSPPVFTRESARVIKVAILSSPLFDATGVNPDTVMLAGAAINLRGTGDGRQCSALDINGDNIPDLVCNIRTSEDIKPGTTIVVMEAKTFTGQAIRGQQEISILSGGRQDNDKD
jgi:hypothetical protein